MRQAAEPHDAYQESVRETVGHRVEESRLEQFRSGPRVSFEEVVCAVENARGEARAAWLGKHGDLGKWLVLWQARHCTGMTLQELGDKMGAVDHAAVSAGLRRFSQALPKQRTVRKWLNATEKILNVET